MHDWWVFLHCGYFYLSKSSDYFCKYFYSNTVASFKNNLKFYSSIYMSCYFIHVLRVLLIVTAFSAHQQISKFFVTLTSVRICFCSVPILKPVIPCSFILCSTSSTDPDPVSAFEAMSPFPFVNPVSFGFYSQTVTLPLRPVPLVGVSAGPGVDSHHLEAVVPGAGELTLAFGSGADAMAVGFASLPASAVSSTVVKLKATSTHTFNAAQ